MPPKPNLKPHPQPEYCEYLGFEFEHNGSVRKIAEIRELPNGKMLVKSRRIRKAADDGEPENADVDFGKLREMAIAGSLSSLTSDSEASDTPADEDTGKGKGKGKGKNKG